jgi:hypothetical protein
LGLDAATPNSGPATASPANTSPANTSKAATGSATTTASVTTGSAFAAGAMSLMSSFMTKLLLRRTLYAEDSIKKESKNARAALHQLANAAGQVKYFCAVQHC